MSKIADTSFTSILSFPSDHPALAGHFPDNPVVPGVVILEAVREVALEAYAATNPTMSGGAQLLSIKQVKFLSLLKPGQEICIEITIDGV